MLDYAIAVGMVFLAGLSVWLVVSDNILFIG